MNPMMQAQEIGDEFRSQAEAMGVPKDVMYAWVAGAMAVEILRLRARLAIAIAEGSGAM